MKLLARLQLAFSRRAAQAHIDSAVEALVAERIAPIVAQYESGQMWSPRRSRLPGYVRDARYDADQMTRLEIVRKSRYFERNEAIVNRLGDLEEEYTVGPTGLRSVPASSDSEWNKRAADWWESWAEMPDLTTLQSFGTLQGLCVRSECFDGEIFAHLTSGRTRSDGRSFPRVQLIETHRVETPPELFGREEIVDGVQIDPNGRPSVYWVREGTGQGESYKPIEAAMMVHMFEPSRPGMYRGLPKLYPVMNELHDLSDLMLLEMDAAKKAASTTEVIKTKTGELTMDDLRRARMLGTGTAGTSGGSASERTQYYEDVFEGRAKVLRHNDDYAQFKPERPTGATVAHWDILTTKICAGWGISKLLVLPFSVQGTVTRADLDTTATYFRSRSACRASHFTRIYRYVMGWARYNEKTLQDAPGDWWKVKVRPPRSVTVDVGRNSNALIEEYRAGWRTLEAICGELGEDYREVLLQRGRELKEAEEIEKELGLPAGSLIAKVLEALVAQNQMRAVENAANQQQPQEQPA